MASVASTLHASEESGSALRRRIFPKSARKSRRTLVIVGNGMASYKLCERLVALRAKNRFRIVVFAEERQPAYDRVHLTRLLHQTSTETLLLASSEWYRENGIELYLGESITAIDREARVVKSARGREMPYDTLVLATGSRAFVPSIPGCDLSGVFVYRTLNDLEGIRAYARQCHRSAVLGGGLLGIEAAKALHDLGLQTWIVERGSSLLARQLHPEAGALLQAHIEKLGLLVCTQRETVSIESHGCDRLLQFNTGECLRVQLIVIAAGIRPRADLAAQCGLEIAPRGGVRVDDGLQTSDPHIFAIGECASHRGVVYGLAAPGFRMADLLAANLMGKTRRRFEGSDQSTRLKLTGLEVATLGDFQANGETLRWNGSNGFRQLVLHKGRLIGATSVGEWLESGRAQELIERRARLWRWQKQRFLRTGRLWKRGAAPHISQWPAHAVICNCMGVKLGMLSAARAEGCGTIEQLARRTGASTVCGSCRPLLAEIVGAPVFTPPAAGLNVLAAASVCAALLAALIFLSQPLPWADSVQSLWRKVDVLWRDPFWKRASGYTLAAFSLVGLSLSLRKRVRWFHWFEFGHWRALHAGLGLMTLVALVTHTGFRLGQNLNFILMTNFLALALVGAAAGMVTACERRLNARQAKRLRAFWSGLHVALAWPLPALVIAHVLIAYYF
ncbi:MAG: FAD-dependent oxidoreductase [Verrucomicrobiota bacterium]